MADTAKALWVLFFLLVAAAGSSQQQQQQYFPAHEAPLRSACDGTLYPQFCVSTIKSFKPGTSWLQGAGAMDFGKISLDLSIKEAKKVFKLVAKLGSLARKLQQRYAIDDCMQLFEITLSQLSDSFSDVGKAGNGSSLKWRQADDVQTWLSAAMTNQQTCVQSLQESQSRTLQLTLSTSLGNVTKTLSTSLALVKNITVVGKPRGGAPKPPSSGRKLFSDDEDDDVPEWFSAKQQRLLQQDDGDISADDVVTVAQDGSGNFSTITDAINAAPNKSDDVHTIHVTAGVYQEYIAVPSNKKNIMLLGDGANVTVITGNRSVFSNFTTFRSATFAAVGQGFMARDITFENTAGPENHQAVALRVGSDLSAFYRCAFKGYQDTLYAHSLRQFYRECDIYGTVDFIFGNAAAVFQNCNLYARKPLPSQTDLYTAQGRDDPNQNTGISIQKCSLTLDPALNSTDRGSFQVFLGRPWRNYSRTVVMESFIDDVVDPKGWQPWSGDQGLATLYYGEYMNSGPGAGTAQRVNWPGYHVMNTSDAVNFTVANLIAGDSWIQSVPFDVGL